MKFIVSRSNGNGQSISGNPLGEFYRDTHLSAYPMRGWLAPPGIKSSGIDFWLVYIADLPQLEGFLRRSGGVLRVSEQHPYFLEITLPYIDINGPPR
jgi:hypothetical protein